MFCIVVNFSTYELEVANVLVVRAMGPVAMFMPWGVKAMPAGDGRSGYWIGDRGTGILSRD